MHVSTLRRTWSTQKLILLAWLAEELSRWNKILILIIVPDKGLEALSWLVEESTGGKGVGKIQIEDMAVRRTFRPPQYGLYGDLQIKIYPKPYSF